MSAAHSKDNIVLFIFKWESEIRRETKQMKNVFQ